MDLFAIAARVAASDGEPDEESATGVVRKTPGKGYCVKSEKNPDWSGGCTPTKGEAEKRLKQVEFFKHKKSSLDFIRSFCSTTVLEKDVPGEFSLEILSGLLTSFWAE